MSRDRACGMLIATRAVRSDRLSMRLQEESGMMDSRTRGNSELGSYFVNQHRGHWVALGSALLLLVGAIDFATGMHAGRQSRDLRGHAHPIADLRKFGFAVDLRAAGRSHDCRGARAVRRDCCASRHE